MVMIRPVLALSVMFFAFLLTPALALAQSADQILDFIWVKTFKFEKQWLYTPNLLIVNAILPTIAVYAIFLGLMRTLRIFESMGSMEHVIALVVTFSGLFLGWIGWVAVWLGFLGAWSVGIFIILFLIGSVLYSWGFLKSFRRTQVDELADAEKKAVSVLNKRLGSVNSKLQSLERKYRKAKPNEQKGIELQMIEWERRRKDLVSEIKNTEEAFLSLPGGLDTWKKKK